MGPHGSLRSTRQRHVVHGHEMRHHRADLLDAMGGRRKLRPQIGASLRSNVSGITGTDAMSVGVYNDEILFLVRDINEIDTADGVAIGLGYSRVCQGIDRESLRSIVRNSELHHHGAVAHPEVLDLKSQTGYFTVGRSDGGGGEDRSRC